MPWCCSLSLFSVSEASSGFLTAVVLTGYLNLRFPQSHFCYILLVRTNHKTNPDPRGGHTDSSFWWGNDKVPLHKNIEDKKYHCSHLGKYSLSYHYSICCLPEFYRPVSFAVVSSFNLFFLLKNTSKSFLTLRISQRYVVIESITCNLWNQRLLLFLTLCCLINLLESKLS